VALARRLIEQGFTMIDYTSDLRLLQTAATADLAEILA
jgi:hypothetical protein